jgi:hypothetical protein
LLALSIQRSSHPSWFAKKELVAPNAVDEALEQDFVAVRELASFTADWLSVQVSLEQAAFATVEEGRELDLRDLVKSVLDFLLRHRSNALGLNNGRPFPRCVGGRVACDR